MWAFTSSSSPITVSYLWGWIDCSIGSSALQVTHMYIVPLTLTHTRCLLFMCADGPRFTSTAGRQFVDLADSVSLTCEVDGSPSASIVWMRPGKEGILSSTPTLTLTSVSEEDLGEYECVGAVAGFPNARHTTHVLLKGKSSHDVYMCGINSTHCSAATQAGCTELHLSVYTL